MKRTLIIFILLSFVICSYSQNQRIKFHLDNSTDSRIILNDYEIKGVKMKLLYDTGSNGNNMLVYDRAKEIGLSFANDSTYSKSLNRIKIPQIYTTNYYFDPIFGPFYLTTHPETFLPFTDEAIDGLVGYYEGVNCIELDFQKQELCFYDTVPEFYFNNPKVTTATLVRGDTGYESKYSNLFLKSLHIQGNIYIADTIKVRTNCIIDTGLPEYLFMSTLDSILLNKAITYKAKVKNEYGDHYPTIRMEIPELSIDTLMTNIKILPKFENGHADKEAFGTSPIGGYLGIEFLKKYTRILFDCKNSIAYFYKK